MNTATIRSDWVGRVIDGRFTLLQWLGGSERSGVFLTEVRGDRPQRAAIKLIPADAGDAEAHIADWALTTTLSHPHLLRLLHTGRCQIDSAPLLYSVTEYGDEVLSEVLPERPLTPSEARVMLDAVLGALSYLHRKGFLHGRVKPSNVMAAGDQVKLSSDCLHPAGEPGKQLPAPTVYDAPERATGTLSPAADVWSLGVTLVEALTQHPPVWNRSTDGEPSVPESIPQPFAAIARECLRSDPARRCTLADVKARLEAAPSLPASGAGGTVHARLRAPALVAAALVLFAIVAAVLFRSHQPRSSPPAEEQQPVPAAAALQPQPPAPETQESAVPETQNAPVPVPEASRGAVAKGAVAERVLPDVPLKASATIRGRVSLNIRVAVDPKGHVSSATLDSPGASKYFASLALEAARNWRFKPARVDGQALSSMWILQFEFTQTGTEVTPVEASP
jgi:TonB family protein